MLNTNLKKDQIYFLGFLLLIGSIVFILLINKYENFGFANYDLGIFFNKIANIDQGYYSYIFHGHSNFYLLLFAALLKIFTLKYIIYFSIFFKVLVLFATAIWIRYKLNFWEHTSKMMRLGHYPVPSPPHSSSNVSSLD